MPTVERDRDIAQLYRDHYHEVLAYCIRRVGVDDAEDVASEVFVVAWRRRADLDMESARAWLFGVARGVVANNWRSAFRRRRLAERLKLEPNHPGSLEEYFARAPESDETIACLRRLKTSDQEVLMLAAWEGLTSPEIALTLGISRSAAEQRLHRAKKRLAHAMRPVNERSKSSPRAATEEGGR